MIIHDNHIRTHLPSDQPWLICIKFNFTLLSSKSDFAAKLLAAACCLMWPNDPLERNDFRLLHTSSPGCLLVEHFEEVVGGSQHVWGIH